MVVLKVGFNALLPTTETTHFNDSSGIIINGDSLIELKKYKSNSIDLLLTDPPYNISFNHNLALKGRKEITLKQGDYDVFESEDAFYNFTEQWFKETVRILKPGAWLYIFFSKERSGYFTDPRNGLFKKYGVEYKDIITWAKTNPLPHIPVQRTKYVSATEFIIVGAKKGVGIDTKIKNYLGHTEMYNYYITGSGSTYKETEHTNEKPVELLRWILKASTNTGDKVIDPFFGSGSTGMACKALGRFYIGIEINKNFYDMSVKRLKKYKTINNFLETE